MGDVGQIFTIRIRDGDIVGVQPMMGDVGQIFTTRIHDGESEEVQEDGTIDKVGDEEAYRERMGL